MKQGGKMKIKIEKKPRLAKKLSIYIRNDWSEVDPLIQGVTIAIPFFYIFITKLCGRFD